MSKNSRNKKKDSAAVRPTQSFAQLMSDAQLNALKPYVQNLVAEQFQAATRGIYQFIMNERSMMMTRQLAFERLLKAHTDWFSEDLLGTTIADVEDEALGLVSVSTPVESGDKVRIEFQAQPTDQTEYGEVHKVIIKNVLTKGPNDTFQTHEALETGLVGLNLNDTREFMVPEPVDEGKDPEYTRIKVTVKRISRAQPKAQEVSDAQPSS